MEGWTCFWCEKGKVTSLPAECPECKRMLSRDVHTMSPQDLGEVYYEKLTGEKPPSPEFYLAS